MSTVYSDKIQYEDEGQSVRPLSTAIKTLKLLDYLGSKRGAVRLAEASADLNANRSTIYQRFVTLIEAGWVEQTDDGRFRLTMHPVKIAGAALEQAGLGERTLPVLQRLVAEVGETASLAVIENFEPVIVQRVEAGGVLQARAQLGTTMDLPTSASGRVLVAFALPEEIKALLAAGAELPDEETLGKVREAGIGMAKGLSGVRAVASPVFDHRQHCVAALSLVGPASRFDVEKMGPPVLAAANKLSVLLGGRPWAAERAWNGAMEPEN